MPSFSPDNDTVRLRVNKKIVDAVKFGEEVELRIKGRVNELESREVPDFDSLSPQKMDEMSEEERPKKTIHDLGVDVEMVEAYPAGNEFSELSREDDD